MKPLLETNLAGTWAFTPEHGARTSIRVPGGGWLKQGFDCEAGTYETRIVIPDSGQPQIVRLELGAVNHLAEYTLESDDGGSVVVDEQITAFTPQEVNLTPHVRPGEAYLLRIAVRAYRGGRPIAPHWAEWCECIARGIFRDAYLRVYPQVVISDALLRTRTGDHSLGYDVWILNASERQRTVTLTGRLSSWNGDPWPYPAIPPTVVSVGPGQTRQVTVGPLPWTPGPDSYWWPNVPYRQGYRARLHGLHLALAENQVSLTEPQVSLTEPQVSLTEPQVSLTEPQVSLTEPQVSLDQHQVRFGFRETAQAGPHYTLNGVRVNLRGDNLQVANYDRIDRGGKGDAIDTLPGFLPPTEACPGWPQAVDNFLRLNYNVQRTHMGPWTPYMLDVCDELGLMLIGESASRWDGFDMENGRGFHEVKCLRDIVRRDRNHPAIIRWSSKNESQCLDPAYHLELYEAIKADDDTRPISEDIVVVDRRAFDPAQVFASLLARPDFSWVEHYLTRNDQGGVAFDTVRLNDVALPLAGRPYGLGEADWMRSSTTGGLALFASTIALCRAQGASDVRPYVLLGSWVSSVPGVETGDLLTEENRHPVYGEDNLSRPWDHPGIRLLQQACHPNLTMDYDFWWLNRRSNAFGHFPLAAPQVEANALVAREITVFNDEFAGEHLLLQWDVREGSASCQPFDRGQVDLTVKPGFMARAPIAFRAPAFDTFIFLSLRVLKDGAATFADSLTCFEVVGGEAFRAGLNSPEREFL